MSDRLTSEQLDQLDAALEAMTPPPWGCYDAYGPASDGLMRCRFVGANDRPVIGNDNDISGRREDFEGLCHLVNQARALVEAARENERLRGALEEIASRENWGIGEHEGNDATVWQGDSAPFDIARAALGEQR